MKEIKSILAAYDRLNYDTQHAALATVVRVEGSSYRRTGARMLVVDDGTWVGGISGGCLEGDALKKARLAIARSKPSLVTYDTTEDDAHQIGVGLGCNGIIDVLLTPVLPDDPHSPISVLQEVVADRRQTNVLLTITKLEGELNGFEMGHIIRYDDRENLRGLGDRSFVERLEQEIQLVLNTRKSAAVSLVLDDGRELEVFAEFLPPELHVIIMGHQYDVFPLVKVIKEAGWRATIVANPQKIHREVAALVSAVVSPEDFSPTLIDDFSAVILMSHDYKTDKSNLPLVLDAPYIGLLGPRVRAERIFTELREDGILISQETGERIFAPVGLDIGAITPEEIALSMVAEIRSVFSQRKGGMLRERSSTIHER
ncbi:XdhC family protein [Persicitalea jodogahamensis]|uniref:Xanthine dehydrogenase accessory factor n=1 Tax=Persicitalea jodogahamensis TaxID=402147 RepID=A0A8J3G923_9BACT|nr:XdhC family protein [Persicitalea jodogahamensis]GHB71141.1 xanthine dehydrogenase accessory factor [Persicitalea jodogahamensis]